MLYQEQTTILVGGTGEAITKGSALRCCVITKYRKVVTLDILNVKHSLSIVLTGIPKVAIIVKKMPLNCMLGSPLMALGT